MSGKLISRYLGAYRGLPKKAWLLSFVVLINRSGSIVLFFLTLYLTNVLNYSVSEAGKIITIYGAGTLSGAFLGGWLTDKIGSVKVQFLSLFIAGWGYIFLSFLKEPIFISVTVFILATIAESFRPANSALLSEVCAPELRTRGFALNRLAINLGVSIGPAIGGFLATVNYKYLFWVDGLTCIGASFLLLLFFGKKEWRKITAVHVSSDSVKKWWSDGPFILLLFLMLLMGINFLQIFNTWPLYLEEYYHLPEDKIGLLLAVNAIMIVLLEMPLVHRIESFQPLKIMAAGAFLLFSGFALLPLNSAFSWAVLTVIIWSAGEILVFPLLAGFIANRADDSNRGKYMGMFSFSFGFAFTIGPAITTSIYESFGPDTLWLIGGLTGIFVSAGFLIVEKWIRE